MKTSVIEMRDMLAVLMVDEVEQRLREIAGVESATVNYAAGNATVRYDETLLEVADIKVLVHQRGKHSLDDENDKKDEKAESDTPPSSVVGEKPIPVPHEPASPPADSAGGGTSEQTAPIASPSAPVASDTKAPADASAGTPVSAPSTSAGDEHEGHEEPGTMDKIGTWIKDTLTGENKSKAEPDAQTSTPAADAPKTDGGGSAADPNAAPAATETAPAPESVAGGSHTDHQAHKSHAASSTQPAMSSDMAHDMGHGGNMDLAAMVRDMRNRFWICLVFAVPIFIYSPMGNLFPAPAPPFGLPLNQ